MRSTKAELLHWNFWQYEKLLCSSCNLVITTLRFHTAYCHTYSEVTHITRWPFSWKKCFMHLTQNNLGHRSVHLLTSDVVSLSLSTVTAVTSKIRKVPPKQCSHSHIALDLCAKKDSLFKQISHACYNLLQTSAVTMNLFRLPEWFNGRTFNNLVWQT